MKYCAIIAPIFVRKSKQGKYPMRKFTFDYPVRHDDLDFMAIIGNAEWITILTRARIELAVFYQILQAKT